MLALRECVIPTGEISAFDFQMTPQVLRQKLRRKYFERNMGFEVRAWKSSSVLNTFAVWLSARHRGLSTGNEAGDLLTLKHFENTGGCPLF